MNLAHSSHVTVPCFGHERKALLELEIFEASGRSRSEIPIGIFRIGISGRKLRFPGSGSGGLERN